MQPDLSEVAACIAGKLIWLVLGLWALTGTRPARFAFAFCCAVSTIAIASGLAEERLLFSIGFIFSAVECVSKAAAFLLLASSNRRRKVD